MLSLGHSLISDLVVANLFVHSLPGVILHYLAVLFAHQRCFCMRYIMAYEGTQHLGKGSCVESLSLRTQQLPKAGSLETYVLSQKICVLAHFRLHSEPICINTCSIYLSSTKWCWQLQPTCVNILMHTDEVKCLSYMSK